MKRLRRIRAIRERFLILSSVAAGLQSAMQQVYLNEELRNNVRRPEGKPIIEF